MAKPDVQIYANQAPRPVSLNGVRVREDIAFTNHKGADDKGTRKRVTKALEKLQDALTRIVASDEVVLYATRGQAPISALGQWGLGWYVYQVTAVALVFTNRRILHLQVDSKGKWKGGLKAVAYGDIADARVKGILSGILWLTYKNSNKDKYWGVRGSNKKLQALLAALLPASAGELTPDTSKQCIQSLCPDCLNVLSAQVYHCAKCGLIFKDESTMTKRAWLIPGGGYFYCRQNLLGVLALMAESWTLVLFLLAAVLAATTWGKPPAKPDDPDAFGMLIAAAILLAALMIEKTIAIHHCRRMVRDFISTGQKDPMRAQTVAAGAASVGWTK